MLINKETGLSSLTNHPFFLVMVGERERQREKENERVREKERVRERESTRYLFITFIYVFN